MPADDASSAVVLRCDDVQATAALFVERLAFRIDAIHPADAPRVVELSGHGVRLRLERDATVPAAARTGSAPTWVEGRAGMLYRDLVPGRLGGRVIASHIRIPKAGPVPDYVHHHRVRFQLIYCAKGWVRVVYEDQGEPFVLAPGDGVVQPPGIRHRVLESSAGLEVIEVTSPAEHETLVDHDLSLPTATFRPDRDFGGQRFARHEAAKATWSAFGVGGFEARDLGVAAATNGLVGARVVRARTGARAPRVAHDGEMLLAFLTRGATTLDLGGRAPERVEAGDAFVVPPATHCALHDFTGDLEMLEVSVPASLSWTAK
jgi:quercetin dioxygenase-like cupin family protein